jgi:hypothetical protein
MALRCGRAPARAAPRAARHAHAAARSLAPPPPPRAAAAPRRSPPPPPRRAPPPLCALPSWAAALVPSNNVTSSGGAARASLAARSSAPAVARAFYAAVNARDLDAALACVDDDMLYEDMIYAAPFEGKSAVAAHLRNVFAALPSDFAFVVRTCACLLACLTTRFSPRTRSRAHARAD